MCGQNFTVQTKTGNLPLPRRNMIILSLFEWKCWRKTVFKFDDEMKSSLSANLWEIGWFSLLQDECESEIGTEKPGGISLIDRDAI